MSIPLPAKRYALGRSLVTACAGAAVVGVLAAYSLPLTLLAVVAAFVVFAAWGVEALSVAAFWALPYMAVNLPTGSFTLKLCDGVAYLLAAAWLARALLRRERIALPPATVQVLLYLGVLAVSALCSPSVADIYAQGLSDINRNAPALRSLSLIIWLGLSWLVVVALYNVVGSRPDLYRRCVRAHILSSGVACSIGLVMYGLGLYGFRFYEAAHGHSLIFESGNTLRLAGVAYEPLFLGFYLITAIPVTLAVRLFHTDWLAPRLCSAVLCLQILSMILTLSSGGWIGLLISLALMALLLRPRVVRARVVAAAVAVVVIGVVGVVAIPRAANIVGGVTEKVTQGGDSIRKQEWNVGYGLIADYPVLGVGPGMARFYFARYHDVNRFYPLDADAEINNVYINVLAEDGIVGFAAFAGCALAGVYGLALPLRRFGPRRVPLLCALLASLVGTAVQFASFNSLFLVYFPMLIGLACVAERLAPTGVEAPAALPAPPALPPASAPAPAALLKANS